MAHGNASQRIYLRPSPKLLEVLDRIVASGLRGSNRAEVAMWLLEDGLADTLRLVKDAEELMRDD